MGTRPPAGRDAPRKVIERDVETAIPDHAADIVLYCGGGYRPALAADNLRLMGYTNVQSMDGGWRAWTERATRRAADRARRLLLRPDPQVDGLAALVGLPIVEADDVVAGAEDVADPDAVLIGALRIA